MRVYISKDFSKVGKSINNFSSWGTLSVWQQSILSLINYLVSLSLAGQGSLHQWPQNLERLKQGNWGPEASTGSTVKRLLFLPASVRKKLKSYCFPSCQGLTVLLGPECPWREHLLCLCLQSHFYSSDDSGLPRATVTGLATSLFFTVVETRCHCSSGWPQHPEGEYKHMLPCLASINY